MKFVLSAGPHGGEMGEFASSEPGETCDFPIEGSQRVDRYELRIDPDAYGDDTGRRQGIYIGAVKPAAPKADGA